MLWVNRRRQHRDAFGSWVEVARDAVDRLPDAGDRHFLAGWTTPVALERARDYVATPPRSPLTEPLLPALRWAVHHWSSQGDVHVVHDEQSLLTPARVAAIADELAVSRSGRRLTGLVRVDSRQDARVQLADLLAGVVRRTAEDQLSGAGGGSLSVDHLVTDASVMTEHAAHLS